MSTLLGEVQYSGKSKGVTRNPEKKRIRIVSDAEYMLVFKLASENVQRLMTLVYRTLQRPSDLLKVSSENIVTRLLNGIGIEVLSIKQSKTGATVDIVLTEDLKQALYGSSDSDCDVMSRKIITSKKQYLILNKQGKPYTLDGFNSNFSRALNKYRGKVEIETGIRPKPFGIYDLKGKGATDMYQSGIALEYIQALAGHESVTTTEIYIKSRLNKPVVSNTRVIGC